MKEEASEDEESTKEKVCIVIDNMRVRWNKKIRKTRQLPGG